MTATLFAFPNADARADREFERTGATDLTRAYDTAALLHQGALAPRRDDGFWASHDAFSRLVARLTLARPCAVADMVRLAGGRLLVALDAMPGFLAAVRHQSETTGTRTPNGENLGEISD